MAFFQARRVLASSLLRALSSSSSPSASFSSMASSRSRIAFAVLPKQTPLLPHFLKFPIRFQTSVSESEESPADDTSEGSEVPKDAKDSGKKSPPKDTILLEGCDLKHWLIIMDFPKSPKPSEEQMVNTYVKTLAEVLGSEEEAKKKIYSVATTPYTGFGAEISEDLSKRVKGLPDVLWVLPDSYMDIRNKDYGGDLFVDGKVIPRPQFRFQKSENKQPNEGENDRYKGRPPQRGRSRDEGSMAALRHSNRNQGRRP